MHRRLSAAAAFLLALVLVLAGSSRAWADGTTPYVWSPSEWYTVNSGTAADATSALLGGDGSTVAVTGQSGAATITKYSGSYNYSYLSLNSVQLIPDTNSGNYSQDVQLTYTCNLGPGNSCSSWRLIGGGPYMVCTDGTVSGDQFGPASDDGSTAIYSIQSVYWNQGSTFCSSHGGVASLVVAVSSGTSQQYAHDGFIQPVTATQATTTTTITCRDALGNDTPVSETSAPGATVAPAPVCPAGSFPVRETVTNSATGVVSDASVSTGSLPNFQSWYFNQGTTSWYLTRNGEPCIVGDPVCAKALSGQTLTPDEQSQMGCVQLPTAQPNDMSISIQAPMSDCITANSQGGLPTQQGSTSGDTTSTDAGVVVRAIEGAASKISSAVNAVNSAVGKLISAVGHIAGDVVSGVSTLVEPDTTALDADWAGVKAAAGSGGTDGWVQALRDMGQAFSVGAGPGCSGPEFVVKEPGYVYYPFNTCSEPGKTIAVVVQAATTGTLAIVGLRMSIRLLWSSFGLAVASVKSDD